MKISDETLKPTESDSAPTLELFAMLELLLEQDDIKASGTWRELQPLLVKTLDKDLLARLGRLIDDFDFPQALILLRGILADWRKLETNSTSIAKLKS